MHITETGVIRAYNQYDGPYRGNGKYIVPSILMENGATYMVYDMTSSKKGFYLALEGAVFSQAGTTFRFGYSDNLNLSKGKQQLQCTSF